MSHDPQHLGPIDPDTPEARRAARFAESAMAALNPTPVPDAAFPEIEQILADLPDASEGSPLRPHLVAELSDPTGDRAPVSEFELRRELRDIIASVDPEVARARLERRLGLELGPLLRDGIERPAIFDAHPNGRNAFRAVFGQPDSLPSIPAVKEFLESSETRAPGWLWARVQAELDAAQPVAEDSAGRSSRLPSTWRIWSAVAALFLAAAWVWSFAGGPIPFQTSDPWTVRERDDSANTGGMRFVEAARPFTNFRSMASIVEDIQDGTPR